MKKLLAIIFGLFICTINAYATTVIGSEIAATMTCNNGTSCGVDYTHGSGCAAGSDYCLGCPDRIAATSTEGVVRVHKRTQKLSCNDTAKTYSCSCLAGFAQYQCDDGYVGECITPTLLSSCNCVKFTCPEGALCAGTVVTGCLEGYYAKTTYGTTTTEITCFVCPENGTCDGETISCDAGYYKAQAYLTISGRPMALPGQYVCKKCPDNTTSAAGSTEVTQCYIPMGTVFSDLSGTGSYTADCYTE